MIGDIIAAALADQRECTEPPEPLLVRASWGDIDALREISDAAYQAIGLPGVAKPLAFMEAITFARLAAAQGDGNDARVLMYLLSQFAAFWRDNDNVELAIQFEADALLLAEAMADEGDEEVGDMVVAAADHIPASVHLRVQQLRSFQPSLAGATE
jgi:hypothetical protein